MGSSFFVEVYDGGNLSSTKQRYVMFGWLMLLSSLHQHNIVTATPTAIEPSESYVGYKPSSGLAVILSAPHGGLLRPAELPERDAGCWSNSVERCIWNHSCGDKNYTKCKAVTVDDAYTQDLTLELHDSLCHLFFGFCPAAVLNRLNRKFYDANRDLEEATFMVPAVVEAFNRYHELIETEQRNMLGTGLFIDIHGHGHETQWAELGYLARGSVLDSGLPVDPNTTSIRSLARRSKVHFDALLRGAESFGGLLGLYGYDSVPSPKHRGPGGLIYFNGGFNTRRHGSLHNGSFDALQIESARTPRNPEQRPKYVKALACTIKSYYCKYYQNFQSQTQLTVSDGRVSNPCAGNVEDECSRLRLSSSSHFNDLRVVYFVTLAFLLFMH